MLFQNISSISRFSFLGLSLLILCQSHFSCRKVTTQIVDEPAEVKNIEITNLSPIDLSSIDSLANALMETYSIPGLSIALLQNGKLNNRKTYGLIQAGQELQLDEEAMFSVGSVSKVVNALLTLRLVEEGRLDLDEDINSYLPDGTIESNRFTEERPVTLRTILSHTAGFSVHGFADYLPEEPLPTTLQILNGSSPAKNGRVFVQLPVGRQFTYSGGGITVVQAIIEELTGLPYHEAAHKILFEPLGLRRTSFQNPLPASFEPIAKAHDGNGDPVALPRGFQSMPEAAASGLWTTASEMATMLEALMDAYDNPEANFLSSALIDDMLSPEPNSEFGLGPRIENRDGTTIVSHDGANDSYRAHFRLYWEQGSGYVIFTNGRQGRGLIRDLQPVLDELLNTHKYSSQ